MTGKLALASLLLTAACAGPARVRVQFAGAPPEALVTVDDRYIGKLGRLQKAGGIELPEGTHRVTVEAVGFFPHDQLVEVSAEAPPPPVQVELEAIPD
ncbi:MAG: hypothetical protein KC933_41245 [Myxococcales bacterium]|nr:hypothetical protein [Myxococcales bacterium]MCA9619845.1 hypothetical protein [Myxococcales bacterium]